MFTPDFKEFLELLNKNQVEYLIVGGYAVAMHGYPRYTGDLDIWIDANRETAAKMIQVLDRVIVEHDGVIMPIININDLQKNKAASGRPKDLEDLRNLNDTAPD